MALQSDIVVDMVPDEVVRAEMHRLFLHFRQKARAQHASGMQKRERRVDHIEIDRVGIDSIRSMRQMALSMLVFGIGCDNPLEFLIRRSAVLFAIERVIGLEDGSRARNR